MDKSRRNRGRDVEEEKGAGLVWMEVAPEERTR